MCGSLGSCVNHLPIPVPHGSNCSSFTDRTQERSWPLEPWPSPAPRWALLSGALYNPGLALSWRRGRGTLPPCLSRNRPREEAFAAQTRPWTWTRNKTRPGDLLCLILLFFCFVTCKCWGVKSRQLTAVENHYYWIVEIKKSFKMTCGQGFFSDDAKFSLVLIKMSNIWGTPSMIQLPW